MKLNLAMRLARSLQTEVTDLFPEAKSALRRKRASITELQKAAANAKKRDALKSAGLDTDSDSWFLVVGFRGNITVQVPIATEDKDRFRANLLSVNTDAPFFVFDSGTFHVAINLEHVQLAQELWEPDPTISEWATPRFDRDDITVYMSGQSAPLRFSGSPEWEESSDDIGQFHYLLDMAQLMVEEHEFFEFLDGDGEAVFLRAHDVALLAIPMWLTDPDFDPEEDRNSVEVEESRMGNESYSGKGANDPPT